MQRSTVRECAHGSAATHTHSCHVSARCNFGACLLTCTFARPALPSSRHAVTAALRRRVYLSQCCCRAWLDSPHGVACDGQAGPQTLARRECERATRARSLSSARLHARRCAFSASVVTLRRRARTQLALAAPSVLSSHAKESLAFRRTCPPRARHGANGQAICTQARCCLLHYGCMRTCAVCSERLARAGCLVCACVALT
jgi:hypothetical protein